MKDSIQEKELEGRLNNLAEIIFSNVKLYVEQTIQRLDPLINEVQDLKTNVATLSTILYSKSLFDEKEYKDLFLKIKKSFGEVNKEGEIDGEIEIIKYNFLK